MVEIIHRKLNTSNTPLWYRIAELTVAAMLIIQCRSIWIHLSAKGHIVNRGVFVIICVAIFICTLFDTDGHFKLNIKLDDIKNCLIIVLYASIFILVNPVNYMRVIRCTIILVLLMLLLYSHNGKEKAIRILTGFKNIMLVVAVVSVVCWIGLSLFHLIDYPWSGDVYVDWSDTGETIRRSHFLYIYYETQWFIVGSTARNSAIFVEGPMACYCFLLALLVELFIEDRTNTQIHMLRICSFIIAIITTFTITGFVALILLGSADIIRHLLAGDKKAVKSAFVGVALIVVLFAVILSWKISTMSGSVRFDDIKACIEAWWTHPFFGSGWENQNYINKYIATWRTDNLGSSNSPFLVLANGGMYLISIYVYAFVRAIVNAVKDRNSDMIIAVLLFGFLFTITIVPYQYITMFFLLVLANGSYIFKYGKKYRKNWNS